MRRKGWRPRRKPRRRDWQRRPRRKKGSSHKSAAPALTSSSIQWRKKWMSSWGPPLILSQVSITPKLNEFFVFAFKYLTDISVILSPDRRYISWLSFVALAYNYNVWFCSARLAFPYHSETANRYWIFLDILSDIVNIIDIIVWQPRLQFVKAGDIIVSHKPLSHMYLITF